MQNPQKLRIRKIGIALAAYQPDPGIFAEQLRSIQEQGFRDWVCVITSDSPLEPLRSEPVLRPFFEDARFVWVENPVRLGHKKNFEKAMVLTLEHGVDAVGCSDQDDIWYPEKLAVCATELERNGPLSLVHSDMHVLRGGRIEERTAWDVERRGIHCVEPAHLLIRNVVAGCSMLLDAELIRRYPRIPEASEYHDHWYALVAATHGGIHPIPKPLFAYRQHGGNTVGVTPFKRVFALPPGASFASVVEKCRKGWRKSQTLSQAAREENLPLDPWTRSLFLSDWDAGIGVLLMGARHFLKDPPLARASIARGLGKAFSRIKRG